MLQLPNGCECSQPTVYPPNWDKARPSLKVDWKIQFYFYDPANPDPKKRKKYCPIKSGINRYKTVPERRVAAKIILEETLKLLQEDGFNFITGTFPEVSFFDYEINPLEPFLNALEMVRKKLKVDASIIADTKTMLHRLTSAAKALRMTHLPISLLKRRHLKMLLEEVQKKQSISSYRYNKYRAYLQMCFKMLIGMEVVEHNIVDQNFALQTPEPKTMRETLTWEQRVKIDNHLKEKNYNFWRFTHIFFHSAGREKELLRLQGKHVDLGRQRYTVLIKKRKRIEWVEKTIKDAALPLWQELMENCGEDDFVFSHGLIPGKVPNTAPQISRRWRTWVKKPLGITADFYSLKHLNLDETSAALSPEAAAAAAGHTSTVITMQNYLVNEKERQHQKLKKVGNSFAG